MGKLLVFVASLCLIGIVLGGAGLKKRLDTDDVLDDDDLQEFNNFRNKFKKNCTDGSTECKKRKRNFGKNIKRLKQLKGKQEKNADYEIGENELMDLDDDEKKKMVFDISKIPKKPRGLKKIVKVERKKRAAAAKDVYDVDWRKKKVVNPVRNQQGCGSCWAFATVSSVEIQSNFINNRTGNNAARFSDQYVLSCSREDGCSGGWPDEAMAWIQQNGVARQAKVPYKSKVTKCPVNVPLEYPVSSITDLTGDPEQIRDFVQNVGPVTVAFFVCEDFYYYTKGVYTGNCSTSDPTFLGGHAVTVIGYGTTATGVPFWLVRNQWGVGWGEAGYFRIGRGMDIAYVESWTVIGPHAAIIPK